MKKIVATYLVLLGFGVNAYADNLESNSPFPKPKGDECPKISFQQYKQVKEGMTYNEVVRVIGIEGTEITRVKNVVAYAWGSKMFYCLTAQFVDGKLYSVSQSGLK